MLKEVASRTMVAGSPAQVVGKVTGEAMHQQLSLALQPAQHHCLIPVMICLLTRKIYEPQERDQGPLACTGSSHSRLRSVRPSGDPHGSEGHAKMLRPRLRAGNPALKMEHWLRTELRVAGDSCEAGGEQFDQLIHGAAEQQSDGKPVAQLTFERQQQGHEVCVVLRQPESMPSLFMD